MRTGKCRCGNRIYFNNHRCTACSSLLGRCTCCNALTSISTAANEISCDSCNAVVHPCLNQVHGVCNSYNVDPNVLCELCQFTEVVPLSEPPSNVQRWTALETAKRRLLLQLRQLEFPPFIGDLQSTHPLRFRFLADDVDANGETKKVITGHENGIITINLAEADSVHREQLRVRLGEPQRTLIGHMRHEIGHYIDWVWATRVDPEGYHRVFGNPNAVDYSEAMRRHYDHGPPADWSMQYVSAYATMHPCEDFAETVNAYLDIMAIATTANDQGRSKFDLSPQADADQLLEEVLKIVIEVSEFNFDLGLPALLPEKLPPAVIEKLDYVHRLRAFVGIRSANA